MTKEITLSDGKIAVIKDGKGRDLLNAQKKAKSSDEIPYALIAELTEIDGNYLVFCAVGRQRSGKAFTLR